MAHQRQYSNGRALAVCTMYHKAEHNDFKYTQSNTVTPRLCTPCPKNIYFYFLNKSVKKQPLNDRKAAVNFKILNLPSIPEKYYHRTS